jgi:excisionase family DNA binding protein
MNSCVIDFLGLYSPAMSKGLTSTEAAERLGVSTARVRRLVLDGRLPAKKFGRDLVIYEEDLESFERLKGGRPPKPKNEALKTTGSVERTTGPKRAGGKASTGAKKGKKK